MAGSSQLAFARNALEAASNLTKTEKIEMGPKLDA